MGLSENTVPQKPLIYHEFPIIRMAIGCGPSAMNSDKSKIFQNHIVATLVYPTNPM